MKVFVTGVTGYLGGSIAQHIVRAGHAVTGLVRDDSKSKELTAMGVKPIVGSLDDASVLTQAAQEADGVINAASADHVAAVKTLIEALHMSGKPLIHTSGSSIIADDAKGEYESDNIYYDDTPIEPIATRAERVEVDRIVRRAGIDNGVRSIVICPTMTYGDGLGVAKDSDQIPKLRTESRKKKAGLYIGKGLNRWSNVYIEDLAELYLLALLKAPSASFFYAENGEETLLSVAEAVSKGLGFGSEVASWDADEAFKEYGNWALVALGANSRVRAQNARNLLGWKPKGPGLVELISSTATK